MNKHAFSQNVLAQLLPQGLGRPLLFYESIESTNLKLKELALTGQPHGTCCVANFQSAGRGRMQRPWVAPPGSSLLFSILLRPNLPLSQLFVFSALAALSICLTLEERGLHPQLKWPNDIYLQGRKLCGILSESAGAGGFLVTGMGINVNQEAHQLTNLGQPAISLKAASGQAWRREDLLAGILNQLSMLYSDWQRDSKLWLPLYQARSWLLGKQVLVQDGNRQFAGLAVAVRADGALLLQMGKETMALNHGDVSVLAIDGQAKTKG